MKYNINVLREHSREPKARSTAGWQLSCYGKTSLRTSGGQILTCMAEITTPCFKTRATNASESCSGLQEQVQGNMQGDVQGGASSHAVDESLALLLVGFLIMPGGMLAWHVL